MSNVIMVQSTGKVYEISVLRIGKKTSSMLCTESWYHEGNCLKQKTLKSQE